MSRSVLQKPFCVVYQLEDKHKTRIREKAFYLRGFSFDHRLKEIGLYLQKHFPNEEIPEYLISEFLKSNSSL